MLPWYILFPQQVIVTAMESIYTLVYKKIIINAKLQIGKRGQNIELTERSPLRKCRSTLDCSASKEEDGYTLVGSDCQRDLSLINQLKDSHASVDTVALTCANINET
jgi:hypothetical protein